MPLVFHFESSFQWFSYAEYLTAFCAGEKAVLSLGNSNAPLRAPKLLIFGETPPPRGSELRFWWLNTAPEAESIAWESLCYPNGRLPRFWMVRGVPGVSVPPLPLSRERSLTIAVVDPTGLAPEPLLQAFEDIGSEVTIVQLEAKDPQAALVEAARAGAEVVHMIADASALYDAEGLLEFPGGATLTAREVHATLRGARGHPLAERAVLSPPRRSGPAHRVPRLRPVRPCGR